MLSYTVVLSNSFLLNHKYFFLTYGHVDGAHECDGVERVKKMRIQNIMNFSVESKLLDRLQGHCEEID